VATQRGYFQPSFIQRIVDEHLAGTREHSFRLWQLVVFELWHRRYLDAAGKPVTHSLPAAAVQSTR
jgi:asparagine synthase (glutamine-hydrolysing)